MTNPVPYTNKFGQVIEVGQQVAYVVTRFRPKQKQGKYLGLSPGGGVTIEVTRSTYRWIKAEEGYVGQTAVIKGVRKRLDNEPRLTKTVLQNNIVFPL